MTDRVWGPWRFDTRRLVLIHDHDRSIDYYEIDLEDCRTPVEMLDWIFQVAKKPWGPRALPACIAALDDLLDPQANLCSFGATKVIMDVREVLNQRLAGGVPSVGLSSRLDVDGAAAFLHIPVTTVRQYARDGVLPAFKAGRRWVFFRDDLETALRRGRLSSVRPR